MTNRTTTTIVVVALALAAGCGSDDNAPAPAVAESATATAAPSTAPYGTYVRRVTASDVKRTSALRDEHGPNQDAPEPGKYRLVIATGSSQDVFKAILPDGFPIAMDLKAKDGVLSLPTYVDPAQGSFCGPEIPAPARYAYTVSGSSLTLEPADPDSCADRDTVLTGSWAKR